MESYNHFDGACECDTVQLKVNMCRLYVFNKNQI